MVVVPLSPGKPVANSVMAAIPLRWWLRPVTMHDRLGEHNAVVCILVNRSPLAVSESKLEPPANQLVPRIRRGSGQVELTDFNLATGQPGHFIPNGRGLRHYPQSTPAIARPSQAAASPAAKLTAMLANA